MIREPTSLVKAVLPKEIGNY